MYESVEFQASVTSDVDENDEMTTEARPVSNSVNTGAEANARLSAIVASESEACSTSRSGSEAFGEGIVVEKDVVYPAAIVNNNSKCSIYIVDKKGLEVCHVTINIYS